METKANTAVPKPQVTQQTPTTKSELTRQVPITLPDPEPQIAQSMRRLIKSDPEQQVSQSIRRPIKPDPEPQVIQSLHRPNPSARRPAPAKSSLVQAFRQILAQQNDVEYITLSSGDEDDNY
jgi:hypothetical protein